MPHIIVETSKGVSNDVDISDLLEGLHRALALQGIDETRIKARAIECPHVVVGGTGKTGEMAHVTLLLLEGRDAPTRKQYGAVLYQVLQDKVQPRVNNAALTLEVREMLAETYFM